MLYSNFRSSFFLQLFLDTYIIEIYCGLYQEKNADQIATARFQSELPRITVDT